MGFLKHLILKVQSMITGIAKALGNDTSNRHSAANLGINYLIESTE